MLLGCGWGGSGHWGGSAELRLKDWEGRDSSLWERGGRRSSLLATWQRQAGLDRPLAGRSGAQAAPGRMRTHMQSFRMETAPFAGRREPHFQSVQRGALSWEGGGGDSLALLGTSC